MALRVHKESANYKVPPHNLDAEQAVLGGILIEKDAINRVLEVLSSEGADFYSGVHAELFKAMVSLFDQNTPIDIVTLSDIFKDSKALNSKGGVSYIVELVEAVPTAANISYYARIVKEKALLRKVITASSEISRLGYEEVESVESFYRRRRADDLRRYSGEEQAERLRCLKDIIKDTFETIEKLYEKKTHITGVATGFKDLDKLTAGLSALRPYNHRRTSEYG